MTIILASSSPARRRLMERLALPFIAISPNIDESAEPGESMSDLVSRLSFQKAQVIVADHPHACVIGCDQLVSVKEQILGKPHTLERAKEQLRLCSGDKLLSLTAMTVYWQGQYKTTIFPYSVYFKHLSDALIDLYLSIDQPLFCAGSIQAEAAGPLLFERCEGDDPTALVGLPLIALGGQLYDNGCYESLSATP